MAVCHVLHVVFEERKVYTHNAQEVGVSVSFIYLSIFILTLALCPIVGLSGHGCKMDKEEEMELALKQLIK